ncbi:MAG: hypothetical protein K1X29_08150 [Bdellovibrionales bacterium]|nr:hypothetical protein [Bdellovibrionales bacterium]
MVISNFKITAQQRSQGVASVNALLTAIDDGKWPYSKSKLRSDFQGFKFHTWVELHPIQTAILVVAGFCLGLFPGIGLIVGIAVSKPARERYEQHLSMLKNGKLAA